MQAEAYEKREWMTDLSEQDETSKKWMDNDFLKEILVSKDMRIKESFGIQDSFVLQNPTSIDEDSSHFQGHSCPMDI